MQSRRWTIATNTDRTFAVRNSKESQVPSANDHTLEYRCGAISRPRTRRRVDPFPPRTGLAGSLLFLAAESCEGSFRVFPRLKGSPSLAVRDATGSFEGGSKFDWS